MLAFDPFAINVFSQPKALVSQALASVLAGLLVALALRNGRTMLVRSPLHAPVAAFVLANVLAAIFALDHRVAIWGAPDRGLGLVATLDNVLLYASVVALVRTRRDLVFLAGSVGVTTLILVAYTIAQKVGVDPIPWASGVSLYRPFGTMGNAGALGQYMATVSIAAAALALLGYGMPWRIRTLAAALATLAVLGTLLAGARSALIGLGVAAAVLSATALVDTMRSGGRRPVRTAVVGVVIVVGVLSAFIGGRAIGSSALGFGELLAGGSVTGRLDIYQVAIEQVRDRPFLGVGPDNYVVAFPRYRSKDAVKVHESDAAQSSTHSWPLKVATDAGLAGLMSFGATGLIGAAVLWRRERRAWAAAAAIGVVAFSATGVLSINHVATDWMPWLALGLIVARTVPVNGHALPRTAGGRRSHTLSRSAPRRIFGLGGPLVGLAVAAMTVGTLNASHSAATASRAHAQGQPQIALAAAQQAVRSDPDRASYWNILGLTHLSQQRYGDAARAFQHATDLAPYDYVHLTNLALAQLGLGLRGDQRANADALATARRAVAMDPNVIQVQYVLALAAEANGEHEEAAATSERSIELSEPSSRMAYIAARAYFALDRPLDAERWLQIGLQKDPWAVDLLLLAAEQMLEHGDRAAAADLIARATADGANARASQLQRRVIESGVRRAVLDEDFDDVPEWTLVEGATLGRAEGNILALPATSPTWRAAFGDPTWTNLRISVQFELPPRASRGTFNVGRAADGDNAVYVSQEMPSEETRLLARVGGSEVQLAVKRFGSFRAGDWYWLEFDVHDRELTAILYHSGPKPRPKTDARVMGALSAELLEHVVASGAALIASDLDPPPRLGGVGSRPGGVYIER